MDLETDFNAKEVDEPQEDILPDSFFEPSIIMHEEEPFIICDGHQVFIKEEPPETLEEAAFDLTNEPNDELEVHIKEETLMTWEEEFVVKQCPIQENFTNKDQICVIDDAIKKEIAVTLQSIGGSIPPLSLDNVKHENKDVEKELTGKIPFWESLLKKKIYYCAYCDYKSFRYSSLKSHEIIHLNTTVFNCTECSYNTKRKSDLKIHFLNHSKTKLFKCPECPYETNRKPYLNTHLLSHSDIKLFQCSVCSYETNRKCDLKSHFLNHTDIKLFQCPDCSYETNHKSHLNRHKLVHSDTKLFQCTECTYETNRKRDLKNHMVKKHSIELLESSDFKTQGSAQERNISSAV